MTRILSEQRGSILILTLSNPDDKVNKLDESLMEQVREQIAHLKQENSLRGAVILSDKESNFMAGADLDMLRSRKTIQEFEEISNQGHEILLEIEQLGKPVVAAIHGSCMGGGTELALACHYRVLSSDRKTKIALPEVKLGLLPGMGGTQRMPRLIGIQQALTYMLTGKNLYTRQAKRMGFADEVVYRHKMIDAAASLIEAHKPGKPYDKFDRVKRRLTDKLLEGNPAGRAIIFSQAEKESSKKTRGNYPAPPKIIEAVRYGFKHGFKKGLENESRLFAELAVTSESRELIDLFFAVNKAAKDPSDDAARPVSRVGVLGAGLMGSGIAHVTSDAGLQVWLKDQDLEAAASGKGRIAKQIEENVEKRIVSPYERDLQLSSVHTTDNFNSFGEIDLVIEAVFEDLELKRSVLSDVEAVVRPDTIIASNTSSIPISQLAAQAKHPERILGMHYFSPVQKMPLLEIIKTDKTSEEAVATACKIGRKQGKTVIVVNDGPGFYTTRAVSIYMNEALILLEEGAGIEQIDHAVKDAGFPVGPVTLLDEVGIDIGAHVASTLQGHFSERGARTSKKSAELKEAGYLGRKNGNGFYLYEEGKKSGVNRQVYDYFGGQERKRFDPHEIKTRLLMIMVNEAVYALQDKVLTNPRDGDIGAVLGLGFPPFLGGPFRYIDRTGLSEVTSLLTELEMDHGPRFRPSDLLREKEEEQSAFFS